MKKNNVLTFLDLFSGIGGFRFGLELAGHKCVGFCEKDKFAKMSYKAIFNSSEEVELDDITEVTNEQLQQIGPVDIITGGFPCQSFSLAGKRRGFEDTRGTLFFEIARFASVIKPKYIFLENVKGLLNHDNGNTFETILRTLDDLGYDAEWQVLNSKDYVAQNRERLFIVGHLRGAGTATIFPFCRNDRDTDYEYRIKKIGNIRKLGKSQSGDVVSLNGIAPTMCSTTTQKDPLKVAVPVSTPARLNKRQNGRRFKTDGEAMFTLTVQDRHGVLMEHFSNENKRVYVPEGAPVENFEKQILVKEGTKKGYSEAFPGDSVNLAHPGSKTRRGRVGKQIANTILTNSQQGTVNEFYYIRKLTPLECWRLQTFPDWAFYAAKFGSVEIANEIMTKELDHYNCAFEQKISNSQLYKQSGNSVTVDVIYAIAKRFI